MKKGKNLCTPQTGKAFFFKLFAGVIVPDAVAPLLQFATTVAAKIAVLVKQQMLIGSIDNNLMISSFFYLFPYSELF